MKKRQKGGKALVLLVTLSPMSLNLQRTFLTAKKYYSLNEVLRGTQV